MKIVVNIPLQATRIYEDDFEENTIPDIGEQFDDNYVVDNKTVIDQTCILDLRRNGRKEVF